MKEQIKIALVDDHQLVRNGIKLLLEEETDIEVIAEGANGYEAIDLVSKLNPDILIIDVRMPQLNGIDAVKAIQEIKVPTKAIVLSMHDSEEYIIQSIKAGAYGYLLKDTDKNELIKAIHTVHSGEKYFSGDISNIIVSNLLKNPPTEQVPSLEKKADPFGLTKKEKLVLKHVLSGKTNSEISKILNNSKRTIETHRFNLMKKMDVKNLMELSAKVAQIQHSVAKLTP